MQVILLERIPKLGQMGDVVRVRTGYARNYLLPQRKALRATEANRKLFESQRAQLEARNLELKSEAEGVATRMDGQTVVMIRSAGERGQLYGSVSTRDIAEALTEAGFSVSRSQVVLDTPIKNLGVAEVPVRLHPEVEAHVKINVARTAAEAERQARGEDVTQELTEEEEAAEEARLAAEGLFEEGAAPEEEELAEGETAVEEATENAQDAEKSS